MKKGLEVGTMDKFIFRKEYWEVIDELKYEYQKKDLIKAILTYAFDKENFDEAELMESEKALFNLIIKLIEKDEVSKFYEVE